MYACIALHSAMHASLCIRHRAVNKASRHFQYSHAPCRLQRARPSPRSVKQAAANIARHARASPLFSFNNHAWRTTQYEAPRYRPAGAQNA
ncbi:hypothetical protein WS68_04015 [Burkholderia sp. TSV86]|nr:hypothetical protein WS68_04015 [Burkholderia sp. TSV86]